MYDSVYQLPPEVRMVMSEVCEFCDEDGDTMPTLATRLPPICEEYFDDIGFQHMASPWQWASSDDAEELRSHHQPESSAQG